MGAIAIFESLQSLRRDSDDTQSVRMVPYFNRYDLGFGPVVCGGSRMVTNNLDGHDHWDGHRPEQCGRSRCNSGHQRQRHQCSANQHHQSAGRYIFVNVHPGNYDITVIKPGFAKTSIPGNVVQMGMVSTKNVTLKVGSESQTIEVPSSGVELQTDNATVGNTVSGLALSRCRLSPAIPALS